MDIPKGEAAVQHIVAVEINDQDIREQEVKYWEVELVNSMNLMSWHKKKYSQHCSKDVSTTKDQIKEPKSIRYEKCLPLLTERQGVL